MDPAVFETLRIVPALSAPASLRRAPDDGDRLTVAADWLLRVASDLLAPDRQSVQDCLSLALTRLQRASSEPGTSNQADQGTGHKTGLAAWQVRRVTAHIDAHLAGSIRNRDLAAAAKLNCGYFCQAFKDSFGSPPHAYIVHRRVERAKSLLEGTDMALSQIALDCGFSDQSHFSRIFRSIAGENPRLWRHKRRLDGPAPDTLPKDR